MSNKTIPKIRFPGFNKDWESSILDKEANFHDSKRVPLSQGDRQTRQGIYPYYGASGIIDYIDDYIFDGEYVLLGEDGANIINRSSPLAFVVNGKFWVNNHAHVLKSKTSNKFLAEALERINYEKYNTGTAQPKLNAEVCKGIQLFVPKEQEQQKITNFLSSVDQKIHQLRRKKELLEVYKKGVMQKIFSQEIRFKDENGENFPDWEDKRLEEILDINYGKDYKDLDEGNIPLIGTGGIMGYVDDYLYNQPSVLIGRKGTIDKPQFIDEPFWTVDTLFYTKVSESVDPYFAYLVVSRINLLKYNEASGVPSLSVRSLNSIKVKLPASFKEQLRISNFVKNIDEKISHIEVKIELTQIFKKGLLQKMFV